MSLARSATPRPSLTPLSLMTSLPTGRTGRFKGANSMPTNDYRRVLDDPAFQNLVRERSGFAWSLLAAMLVIYYGFIMLVAFAKPLLAAKVGGGVTSVGIVMGLGGVGAAC